MAGERLETPWLRAISYQPSPASPIVPTRPRPTGASCEASEELLADHPTPGSFPARVVNASTLARRPKL
jgi:hypothetical protein